MLGVAFKGTCWAAEMYKESSPGVLASGCRICTVTCSGLRKVGGIGFVV